MIACAGRTDARCRGATVSDDAAPTYLAPPILPTGRPTLVGVVNVTEDSFSDGGRYLGAEQALEQARRLLADGAEIIELGPAASNPDAAQVTAEEERRRLIGSFAKEPLKRASRYLQQQAVLVCNHISGARAVIEQRHFAEEFAGRQRRQNALLASDHQPHTHFPFEHQIHAVARAALFDDFRRLPHGVKFGEPGETFELCVGQSGKNSNTPNRPGSRRQRSVEGSAERERRCVAGRTRLKKHLQFRNVRSL